MTLARIAFFTAALASIAPFARADGDAGTKVYKQAVNSVVWVHSQRDRALATGTGSLIDVRQRLVITNYHVVEDVRDARVFFPETADGELKAEKQYYKDRANRLAIRGKVVAKDPQTDLAIIQLERVPAGAKAISLADGSPLPGQSVHSIGNAGKSGALWGYVPGKVRNVYRHKWQAEVGGRRLRFEAKVVETDSPTNHGDSGGPLLNDTGELVGVTEGAAVDAQLVSTFVDVSEVKRLLASAEFRITADKPDDPPAKPKAKREKSLPVSDKAKVFTEDGVKKAQAVIDELFEKHKIDVLVETIPTVPDADKEKVKELKGKELTDYFRDLTRARAKAEGVSGFVVVLCKEPRKFFIEPTQDVKSQYSADTMKTAIDKLTAGLKADKPDDALLDVVGVFRDKRVKK